MLMLIVTWIVSAFVLYLTAALVPGFKIVDFGTAIGAVIVIGLLNAFLRPILLFLSLPINILTLGLFTFVVNAAILRLTATLFSGFQIRGWIPAILGAIVLALINAAAQMVFVQHRIYY